MVSEVSMHPLQNIWACWDIENTRIDLSTLIGLVQKDTERLLYPTTMLTSLSMPFGGEWSAIGVQDQHGRDVIVLGWKEEVWKGLLLASLVRIPSES
jgi:hypothetical protein